MTVGARRLPACLPFMKPKEQWNELSKCGSMRMITLDCKKQDCGCAKGCPTFSHVAWAGTQPQPPDFENEAESSTPQTRQAAHDGGPPLLVTLAQRRSPARESWLPFLFHGQVRVRLRLPLSFVAGHSSSSRFHQESSPQSNPLIESNRVQCPSTPTRPSLVWVAPTPRTPRRHAEALPRAAARAGARSLPRTHPNKAHA